MVTTVTMGSILTLLFLNSPSNPVKMSIMLVILSMILFAQIMTASSSVWMSGIFFMIFIGGIMIMFMILSSLLPNEKNMKTKSMAIFTIFLVFICSSLSTSGGQLESSFNQESKVVFLSNQSFEALMLVILLYFLSFVFIVSKETTSLRSFLCYWVEDFVILYVKISNFLNTKKS